jgi:putative membrane protein
MHRRVMFVRIGGPEPEWSFGVLAVRLAVNATGLFLASRIVPGITIGDWQSLLAGTAIFAIVNMLLRPLAYLVSCCLILFTFGLFTIVVNAGMLGATAWAAGQLNLSFTVEGFWDAVLGSLVISAVSIFAGLMIGRRRAGR